MARLLLWIGRISGSAGAAVSVVAVAARVTGHWQLGGLSVGTLLQAGVGAMVLGCLAYAALHAERPRP